MSAMMIVSTPPMGYPPASAAYLRPVAADRPSEVPQNSAPENAQATESERADDNEDSKRLRRANAAEASFSEDEQRQLRELQQRDREVRAHEQAHVAAGGSLVIRGAVFEYETGPDGQRYAVGGEVTIDTSPGRTPQETVTKAQRIIATALAPMDPSPQDRRVASDAQRMSAEARIEVAREAQVERTAGDESDAEPADRFAASGSGSGAGSGAGTGAAIAGYERQTPPMADLGASVDYFV